MNAIKRRRVAQHATVGMVLLAFVAACIVGIAGSVRAMVPTALASSQAKGDGRCPSGKGKSDPSSGLEQCQLHAINDEVLRCYEEDTSSRDFATYSAMMTVRIDAEGIVQSVVLSRIDQARANSDPAFRAFAERAEHAVQDPVCAHLPLPPNLLGQPSSQLTFRFRP